jgi:gas vesicle protein
MSTPDEQIGYMASEEFASRMASPRPQSSGRPTSIKAGHTDSPLRNEAGQEINDKGEVIHIDPPAHRSSKVHGGGYDPPTEDLGPEGGNTSEKGGYITERGYGIPILASDELQKHPDAEWRQPAVSPELERHGNEYTVNEDGTPAYITKVRSHSRSSSRNNSGPQRVISSPAHFDRTGTPLESHKEYEPLFPEDEDDNKKPKSQVDKLKRPSVARHQFPSQDVWEDTPGSLQLETTVDTPEPQASEENENERGEGEGPISAAKVFENPETEEERKNHITKQDQQSFLPEHTRRFAAENKLLGKVRDEAPLRPGMQQRFPSQDIWEDAPSHGHLETTVSTPQIEDTNEYAEDSPVDAKPQIPARPSIPARPAKKETSPVDKKAPIIPDRPKPQLPARPSKPSTGSSENVPTLDARGAGENTAPQPKAKPPVPARPAGSKIAALQAGFLQDLNSKLGLGPQAPKVKEPEPEPAEEAAPLQDARKGRAKGPQRRKPASSPTPAAATITAEVAVPSQKLSIGEVTTIWSFGQDGSLEVPAAQMAAKIQESLLAPVRSADSKLAPSNLEKPDGTDHVVNRAPEVESEDASLTKTTTQGSDAPATLEGAIEKATSALPSASETSSTIQATASQASDAVQPALSKASETVQPAVSKAQEAVEPAITQAKLTLEPALSQAQETLEPAISKTQETLEPAVAKVSSALQSDEPLLKSEEPLVTEHTAGSVEAPGAFPGSGPDLDDETDKDAAKEGAGFTQTFAG